MSARFFLAGFLRDTARQVDETSAPVGMTASELSDCNRFYRDLQEVFRWLSADAEEHDVDGFELYREQIARSHKNVCGRKPITLNPLPKKTERVATVLMKPSEGTAQTIAGILRTAAIELGETPDELPLQHPDLLRYRHAVHKLYCHARHLRKSAATPGEADRVTVILGDMSKALAKLDTLILEGRGPDWQPSEGLNPS